MKRMFLMAAASILIGGSAIVGCDRDKTASQNVKDNAAAAKNSVSNAAEKAGSKIGAATQPTADAAIKGTRNTLSNVVEAALDHNDFNKLVSYFSKADRDRIGKVDKDTLADLNAAIGKFKNDWKTKYNQDFKLSDKEQVVFGTPVAIQVGEAAEARLAGATQAPVESNTNTGKDAANNVTTVTIPAAGSSAPAVSVTLRNEGTVMKDYKIDVPDTLDANKLKANLITHINHIDGMQSQWPSDVNEAARIVSQHILAAITDTNAG